MLPIDRTHLYDGKELELECVGERVFIPGPVGLLEGLTACPERETLRAVAVILHPHPLYGGTLNNKVVHYLSRSCNRLGIPSLRFNFRGVGESGGHYDDGRGETDDCLAVLDWVAQRRPGFSIWLAGFSFGAYVAYRAARDPRVRQLITVAPPVNLFDFTGLPEPQCPWMVIQGESDELVPADAVWSWLDSLPVDPERVSLPADHFFHGRLATIEAALLERFQADPAGEGDGRDCAFELSRG
ncbi:MULTISPECIES: alpha/beta hydrolase [Acidithiobacillus]|jgi:alpha/beta superfamily hydrolase|uniref:alpha/beta hydrolase n=1 Tax=Acidithiobacillus TaxID=119977 RepID=UPI001C07BD86|nr:MULTISPECIES: alpha/beta fold hydrolase [Acidithiobacillus]MBU2764158.1 alpha/beta fold hydrolase [Acidithiobacillus caldus]MBU2772078.1 alpha/beta fold hydrolase [Acidithiobacillus caldus]MBU2783135.1 alpha/beta fold hydrolase [Acidithiobacillus caldus]MCE5420112.1 alpha/beta fold hydrolase [Acidithiobacillus sp.]